MANKKLTNGKKNTGKPANSNLKSLDLLGAMQGPHQSSSKSNLASDLRKLSSSSRTSTTPISFGKASNSGSSTSSSSAKTDWASLLHKTASGGGAKLLGGGLLSFGIHSLFSGISDLLGSSGETTPPPLKRFSLPDSQEKTISSSSSGGVSGTGAFSKSLTHNSGVIYGPANNATNQAAIVQAVKNALLTSSSLNDIIGEL